MLKANNLSHSFDYPLFENVSLTLNPKESIAILGVSGSGKSTLLHILSTLLKPDTGTVDLLEEDIYELSEKKLLELRRESIGIIFQQHYLFKGFSAQENLEVAALLSQTEVDPILLEKLGVSHLMDKKVTDLSGGQQQRISIARVLTKKPKLIFADEPTGNLDDQTANDVMQILNDYIEQNSAAMVMVTHDKRLALGCTQSYTLEDKQLTPIE